ncbi:hypothetical protein [Kribbella sindirgiensis]|nr:hypothetical protein [Kribbella sindirgiensis]
MTSTPPEPPGAFDWLVWLIVPVGALVAVLVIVLVVLLTRKRNTHPNS